MLCKNPAQRVSMDELRQHPWVNYEEPEFPLRINPRVSGNVQPAALGQFILGMEYDKGVTTYKFHEHKKQERPFSFSSNKPTSRSRANTVHQDKDITLTKKEDSAAKQAALTIKSENSTEKKSTFSFFRRKSVNMPEDNPTKQTSISSVSPVVVPTALPLIVGSGTIAKESDAAPAMFGAEKSPQALLIPGAPQYRRHSTMGSTLTPPVPVMTRRASDIGIDPHFLKNGGVASEQRQQGQNIFANLSAMLKRSSSSVARHEEPSTSSISNSGQATISHSSNETGSRDNISRPLSPLAVPTAPVNRLIRSITFNGQSPEIQIPVEEKQSGAASPLIPPSGSIRQLRLAAHSPMVQRRESFGAKKVVTNDLVKGEKLLVPGNGDDIFLGKISKGKKEISKSYHAFLSMSETEGPQARSEIMKSAILGQLVSDSEDRLGSHDMMSLTSRFTENATSSDQDESHGEMETNIEYWKELNRPAQVIRSMRFSFNQKTSSTMDPADIFRELTITLNKLNQRRPQSITYSRTNLDYYLLMCKFRNPFSLSDDPLIFEVEVCKVWLLKLHGLRIKRIAGSPLLFKELYSFLETELRI